MTATEVQLRLDIDVPVLAPWRLSPAEVHAGKVWLPRCREALAQATEVQSLRAGGGEATEVRSP